MATPGDLGEEAQIEVVAATRHWLETAVIGLDLCPFARAVYLEQRIRYVVTPASDTAALLAALLDELEILVAAAASEIETTLLIHPRALGDFLAFNDFLAVVEAALEDLGLATTIQVASFHPQYQFAGTAKDDVENCTNRAPYPILHLLRQASVSRAVDSLADPAVVFERNIATLRRLGWEGWRRLGVGPAGESHSPPAPPLDDPAV
jgi:uncharacterized protein